MAVFGGSFDPPHLGHRKVVEYLLDLAWIHHILLVPAHSSPDKEDTAGPENRLKLIEGFLDGLLQGRSVKPDKTVGVDSRQILGGPVEEHSSTAELLRQLARENQNFTLFPVIGCDILKGLENWLDANYLKEFEFLVFPRAGTLGTEEQAALGSLHSKGWSLQVMQGFDGDGVSSTQIRQAKSLEQMDNEVADIVRQFQLYDRGK